MSSEVSRYSKAILAPPYLEMKLVSRSSGPLRSIWNFRFEPQSHEDTKGETKATVR